MRGWKLYNRNVEERENDFYQGEFFQGACLSVYIYIFALSSLARGFGVRWSGSFVVLKLFI